jgi:hypothetical protein
MYNSRYLGGSFRLVYRSHLKTDEYESGYLLKVETINAIHTNDRHGRFDCKVEYVSFNPLTENYELENCIVSFLEETTRYDFMQMLIGLGETLTQES